MIEAVQRLKRNAETLFTEDEIKALGEPNRVNIYKSDDEDVLIVRAQHRDGLDVLEVDLSYLKCNQARR